MRKVLFLRAFNSSSKAVLFGALAAALLSTDTTFFSSAAHADGAAGERTAQLNPSTKTSVHAASGGKTAETKPNASREDAEVEAPPVIPTETGEPLKAYLALESGSERQLRFALEYARRFAQSQQSSELELVAGKKAVSFFLADRSPVAEEFKQLHEQYPNIRFYVCQEAIKKLKQLEKTEPQLLPGAALIGCDQHFRKLAEKGWSKIDLSDEGPANIAE